MVLSRRQVTENIRAVAKIKMEGKRPRGLRWRDTVGREDGEEWTTDRTQRKGLCKRHYPAQGDGSER